MRTTYAQLALYAFIICLLGLSPALTGCDYTLIKDQDSGNPVGPGPGGDDSLNVSVTVSPAVSIVEAGGTQLLTATVTGTPNTSVTWSIASGVGVVSALGLYSAPASITADTVVVVVKATSTADPGVSASATINVVKSPTGEGDTGVCFEREVLPIFQSNCAMSGCHAAPGQDGYIFSSYETILAKGVVPGQPYSSEIFEKITEDRIDKRMPPSPRNPLTADQIETIRTWIAEGARNTKCSDPSGECDTTNVTFAATIQPILRNNCYGCHSGFQPSANLRLDLYDRVKTVADNGKLYGVVSHANGYPKMPYQGNKLADCQIAKIKAWIDRGALNN